MTRKSAMTDRLKSDPAQTMDSAIKRAKKAYDAAAAAVLAKAGELAASEERAEALRGSFGDDVAETSYGASQESEREYAEAKTECERLSKEYALAVETQNRSFDQLIQKLRDKYESVSDILSLSQQQIADLQSHVNPFDASEAEELATAMTDHSLIAAALADVEAQIKDLEKKQQGKRKRNPAPSKRSRKGSIEAKGLTKEIVAVLAEADKVKTTTKTTDTTARYRLKTKYRETVIQELVKKFNYANVNQVPKVEKILLNMGLGDVKDDGKEFNKAVDELKIISGQKPISTTAKKSIANFKVRQGMNIGAKVTLRGDRMYEFLDKLISIALPRVRDFKGVNPNSFDGRGNYAMGVKEQLIFPEIKYDQISKVRGFDIVIVTSAKTDEEAKELLKLLGMPFRA